MRVLVTGAAGYGGSILVDTLQAIDSVSKIVNDLALLLGKRAVIVPQILLRGLFALCWHASRGRIPTPRGAWKFVTFPIAVDGSALTRAYGCRYRFTSADALMARSGAQPAGVEVASATLAPAPAAAVVRSELGEA